MNDEQETPERGAIRRPAEGIRVAVAQIAPKLGDVAENLEKHRDAVTRAHDAGAQVVVFPELSLTGYRLKDSVPEVALTRDHALMAELNGLSEDVAVVAGFVEETREHHFFNSAAWLERGRATFTHRKSYLPTYGMFDEQRYFARGKRIRAFDTQLGRSAILVCEDMLHPTALTIAALDGAECVYVPSASPVRGVNAEGDVDANGRYWENYIRTMARAVGVFVVYANRVGVEDGHTFWGGSEIVGPDGSTLAKAAYYDEDLITAVLPEGAIRRRRIQFPALRDEDVDLTINELERIRERTPRRAPAEQQQQRRGGQDRRRDDDQRRGRYGRSGGYDQRGGGGGGGGRDRRGGGNWQPRDNTRENRGRWQPRDDNRQGQGQGGRGRWFQRDDARDDQRARYRPQQGERQPRPLGGLPVDDDADEDKEP
jgi:predicted amidohydrolase